jgi:hAT family C-terminal dimerisation region
MGQQPAAPGLDAGDELEVYYKLDRITVDNPIQWWVDYKGSFPRLSKLALDILAIPST